jgi:hypothetical protein
MQCVGRTRYVRVVFYRATTQQFTAKTEQMKMVVGSIIIVHMEGTVQDLTLEHEVGEQDGGGAPYFSSTLFLDSRVNRN